MGSEVATTGSAVPALAHDPSTSITAEDIAFGRLYIGQDMHGFVQEGLVKRGSIFTATGADDPDPVVIAEPGDTKGVDFFVLGLKKGKSISRDGELFTFAFDDPDAPEDAWTTYTYAVALPSVDDEVPLRWLLTRSARPTAQKINQVLARNAGTKPSYANGFNLTTKETSNTRKQKFFIPVVRPIEPTEDQLAVASKLNALFQQSAQQSAPRQSSDEPAI